MSRTVSKPLPWLITGLICVAHALAGCVPAEAPPDMNAVLPAGYSEKRVPKDLENMMGLTSETGLVWARCIDCREDWDGLKIHLLNQVEGDGWSDTTRSWLPKISGDEIPRDIAEDMFYIISSTTGNMHIMAINLQVIRDIGGTIDTTGDYYVMAGWDNIDYYE